jgi:hypothetical protein
VGFVEIVGDLEIHPEFGRGTRRATEQDGRFCRAIALSIDKPVHTLDRYVHPPCQLNLGYSHRLEELQEKEFARMGRQTLLGDHVTPTDVTRRF